MLKIMFDQVRADLAHYSRFCCRGKPLWQVLPRILYTHPASWAVIWYRLGSRAWRLRTPVLKQLLQLIYLIGMPAVRFYSGVQLQPTTRIGPGLAIMHFGGVVVAPECRIGDNCLLYHNVSIVTMRNRQGPQIGNNFYAGVGTTIIGSLIIEDNVTAGAACVITKSVPEGAVVAGVPARIIRYREPGENPAENKTLPDHQAEWLTAPPKSMEKIDRS
jgi:serine O-acetyltransferase